MLNFDMTGEGDGLWGAVSARAAPVSRRPSRTADASVGSSAGSA